MIRISMRARDFLLSVIKTESCWLWTGPYTSAGYGVYVYRDSDGKQHRELAHRAAYELFVDMPIPDGFEIDHVKDWGCTNVSCVNPGHLQAVTQYENNMRSNSFAAERKRATECIHGHEFTPDNTIIARNGTRHCRTCKNIRRKQYRRDARRLSN